MKKLTTLLMCAALVGSCGGETEESNETKNEAKDTAATEEVTEESTEKEEFEIVEFEAYSKDGMLIYKPDGSVKTVELKVWADGRNKDIDYVVEEYEVYDENGNLIYDEEGNVKVKTDTFWVKR